MLATEWLSYFTFHYSAILLLFSLLPGQIILLKDFASAKRVEKRHLYQLLAGKENSSIFSLLHLYYAVIFSLFTHSYGKHFRNYHKNLTTLYAKMKGMFATLL